MEGASLGLWLEDFLSFLYPTMHCFALTVSWFEDMAEIKESINKYRHTFTYGEFKLLPERNSTGPWAGTPVRGCPWMGSRAFWSVLLRLAAGVTCCTLGFEHLAPEIFPSQVAPLHLFITESKQRRELNVWQHLWNSLKFLSTSCQWHLGNSCWMIFEGLGFGSSGSGRRETKVDSLSLSWKQSCLSCQIEVIFFLTFIQRLNIVAGIHLWMWVIIAETLIVSGNI